MMAFRYGVSEMHRWHIRGSKWRIRIESPSDLFHRRVHLCRLIFPATSARCRTAVPGWSHIFARYIDRLSGLSRWYTWWCPTACSAALSSRHFRTPLLLVVIALLTRWSPNRNLSVLLPVRMATFILYICRNSMTDLQSVRNNVHTLLQLHSLL
jgi:hypothetical protein